MTIGNHCLISTGIWTDPWFQGLNLNEKLIWLYLIVPADWTKCGIFEFKPSQFRQHLSNGEFDEDRLGIPIEEVKQALDTFKQDGKIAREGEGLWIIKYTEYQRYSGKAMTSAQKEADELTNKWPGLVEKWRSRYLSDGGSIPHQYPIDGVSGVAPRTEQNKSDQNNNRELTPAQLALLPTVNSAIEMINRFCVSRSIKNSPVNDPQKSVVVVEQLHRIDGIDQDQILPAFEWGLNHDFWKTNILSIRQWRKKGAGNGLAKFVTMHQQWKQANGTSTELLDTSEIKPA